MMDPIEIFKFVQSQLSEGPDRLHALAALGDAPPEDFQPLMRLPVQNPIPAFKVGNDDLGNLLANQNHGVPAPVLGQDPAEAPSIGHLLVGDIDGSSR